VAAEAGSALPQLLATHEVFEASDLLAGAEDYKGVASPEAIVGGGRGVEGAFLVAGGEDHGPGPLPESLRRSLSEVRTL
jgi:hypothetical protein